MARFRVIGRPSLVSEKYRAPDNTVRRSPTTARKADGEEDAFSRVYALWDYSCERYFDTTIDSKKFEPEPLDPSGFSEVYRANEREQLSGSDFIEEGMRKLVRRAYEREMITLSKVAEHLQTSLSEARGLAGEWRQERSLGS